MSYAINRYIQDDIKNPDFYQIRDIWQDSYGTGECAISFGAWLKERNVDEEYTGIRRKDPNYTTLSEPYTVTKIIFKSESEYLAFKLKYL
jgi:hypothetical protein